MHETLVGLAICAGLWYLFCVIMTATVAINNGLRDVDLNGVRFCVLAPLAFLRWLPVWCWWFIRFWWTGVVDIMKGKVPE